nr:uncharacterized protein DDB_G0283697 [Ipomoea batatas]
MAASTLSLSIPEGGLVQAVLSLGGLTLNEYSSDEGNETSSDEGNENSGYEGNEDSGDEGNEDSGDEGNEDSDDEGNEGDEDYNDSEFENDFGGVTQEDNTHIYEGATKGKGVEVKTKVKTTKAKASEVKEVEVEASESGQPFQFKEHRNCYTFTAFYTVMF